MTFIGCTKGDVPTEAIKLQTVAEHPEANWVKWCVRFRRTLKDRRGIEHPLAEIFTNQFRVRRLLNTEAVMEGEAAKCKEFLAFHSHNPQVLADMIERARTEKTAGRSVYAIEAHLSGVRWSSDLDTERADAFKINSGWSAWYSRLIQMDCPDLIGFFRLRIALADGLVMADGRSWRDFAKQHSDELHYDNFESLPDSEWEYND